MQQRTQNFRRKSCQDCTVAKTRCDLKRPTCSRCSARQTSCQYAAAADTPPDSEDGLNDNDSLQKDVTRSFGGVGMETTRADQTSEALIANLDAFESTAANLSTIFGPDCGLFDPNLNPSLNLFDNFDASIPNSQLSVIRAGGNQTALSILPSTATTPSLVRHSMEFILRVLRTWPRMMAKGVQLPPMIHPTQSPSVTKSKWLSNCYTIVKMWFGQCPGTSEIVQGTVKREMEEIMSTVCPLLRLISKQN